MADSDNTTPQEAEALINSIELTALQAVLNALTTCDNALKAVLDNYPLSSKFQSMARQIATETRSNQQYRITQQLPGLIAGINGSAPPAP